MRLLLVDYFHQSQQQAVRGSTRFYAHSTEMWTTIRAQASVVSTWSKVGVAKFPQLLKLEKNRTGLMDPLQPFLGPFKKISGPYGHLKDQNIVKFA